MLCCAMSMTLTAAHCQNTGTSKSWHSIRLTDAAISGERCKVGLESGSHLQPACCLQVIQVWSAQCSYRDLMSDSTYRVQHKHLQARIVAVCKAPVYAKHQLAAALLDEQAIARRLPAACRRDVRCLRTLLCKRQPGFRCMPRLAAARWCPAALPTVAEAASS
jgi:hypothetical protein